MDARSIFLKWGAGCFIFIFFSGCWSKVQPIKSNQAVVGYETQVSKYLKALPPPSEPIVLAIYKFRDQTGQYKPGTGTTGWSTAVTQGATSMLVKALADAGRGKWFTVLERESLPNLLNERKIIRQTRKQYLGQNGKNRVPPLSPLLYAPIMLDGGIIAFESNLLTGGLGARYLGIGGSTEFSRDTVTIYLRAISVKNGQVLKSVTTSKTIFAIQVDASVFKFIGFRELLEIETGFTTNEPPQMAVLEAIEYAVYSMVLEGVIDKIWSFENPRKGKPFLRHYQSEKIKKVRVKFDQDGNLIGFEEPKGKKKREGKKREDSRLEDNRGEDKSQQIAKNNLPYGTILDLY